MIRPQTLTALLAPRSERHFLIALQELFKYIFDPFDGQVSLRGQIPNRGELFHAFLKETFDNIYQGKHPASDWGMTLNIASILDHWHPIIEANSKKDTPHSKIFYDVPSALIDYLASLIYLDSESPQVRAASEQIVLFLEALTPSYPYVIDNYRKMDPATNLKHISKKIQEGIVREQCLALSMVVSMWYARGCPFDTKDPRTILLRDTLLYYDKGIANKAVYKEGLIAARAANGQDIPWIWQTIATKYRESPPALHGLFGCLTPADKAHFLRYYMKFTPKLETPDFHVIHLLHPYFGKLAEIIKTWPEDEYEAMRDFLEKSRTTLEQLKYNGPNMQVTNSLYILREALVALRR